MTSVDRFNPVSPIEFYPDVLERLDAARHLLELSRERPRFETGAYVGQLAKANGHVFGLDNADAYVEIAPRAATDPDDGKRYTVTVQLKHEARWRRTPEEMLAFADAIADQFGERCGRSLTGEIHLAIDQQSLTMAPDDVAHLVPCCAHTKKDDFAVASEPGAPQKFSKPRATRAARNEHETSFRRTHWKGRARKPTGGTIGKGTVKVCRYDKTEELRLPGNEDKSAVMHALWERAGRDRGVALFDPAAPVTRTEVRLARAFWKDFQGGAFKYADDAIRLGAYDQAWAYVTRKWIREVWSLEYLERLEKQENKRFTRLVKAEDELDHARRLGATGKRIAELRAKVHHEPLITPRWRDLQWATFSGTQVIGIPERGRRRAGGAVGAQAYGAMLSFLGGRGLIDEVHEPLILDPDTKKPIGLAEVEERAEKGEAFAGSEKELSTLILWIVKLWLTDFVRDLIERHTEEPTAPDPEAGRDADADAKLRELAATRALVSKWRQLRSEKARRTRLDEERLRRESALARAAATRD